VDATIFPPVRLSIGGAPNHRNVSSYVANTGETVNIGDVYDETDQFDFSGVREYDTSTGYRSRSMLVTPLTNRDGVIGVLQLINARDPETGEVVPFAPAIVELTQSLASLAAVALTNARLIQEMEYQFEMFTKSIAAAIDAKSPSTAGHVRRVAEICQRLARAVNEDDTLFPDVRFDADQMQELRIAAWLHDIGKITTPEYVLEKKSKLFTVWDRFEIIQTRYGTLAEQARAEALRRRQWDEMTAEEADAWLEEQLGALDDELAFLERCTIGEEGMSDEKIARVHAIAETSYTLRGKTLPRLTSDEVKNLCIRRGTLNDDEFVVMRNHAVVGLRMLTELPFTPKLANVPFYAGAHHERLDGTGYPQGLKGDELPIQARILAVADVLEALTAQDRPYRKPIPVDEAMSILQSMAGRALDPTIIELILTKGIAQRLADAKATAGWEAAPDPEATK
ncbi:MAG: HD domain-containing protein, partial [Phycisphaerales bacterium]|nr:HD domain-containing protein [Phycisphaerales bacterium]